MTPDTTVALGTSDTEDETNDPQLQAGSPQENVARVVGEAKPTPKSPINQDRYNQALDFFLDDANDVNDDPLEENIDVLRWRDGEEFVAFTGRIRTLSATEVRQARSRGKQRVQQGRGQAPQEEVDDFRFHTVLITSALVHPNLKSDEVISKFRTAERAVEQRLLPGEIVSLGQYILMFSGFGDSVVASANQNQTIEAAKN